MNDVLRSATGMLVLMAVAWLLSSHKRRFPIKIVVGGLTLQFALALLVLRTELGRGVFDSVASLVTFVLIAADQGANFVFGLVAALPPVVAGIKIMSTIIVCSALSSIGYHYGVLQQIVRAAAYLLSRVLGVSGAESLSGAANIFLGQTEAPLLIKPYIPMMTRSELMAVMTGGFATIAMGVMAVYVDYLGVDANGAVNAARRVAGARHLLTASIISAPAAFIMAKIMIPETEVPATGANARVEIELQSRNGLDAAAIGASDGMKLAINVLAMLIAFIALIKLINLGLEQIGAAPFIAPTVAALGMKTLDLQSVLGLLFSPVAYFIGVDQTDLRSVGTLLGTAMSANEFLAYASLSDMLKQGAIGERSATLATFALCGFANLSSIGIQIAGIGSLAPSRRSDLADLAPRAMLGGAMASWMTACVAGMLIA